MDQQITYFTVSAVETIDLSADRTTDVLDFISPSMLNVTTWAVQATDKTVITGTHEFQIQFSPTTDPDDFITYFDSEGNNSKDITERFEGTTIPCRYMRLLISALPPSPSGTCKFCLIQIS